MALKEKPRLRLLVVGIICLVSASACVEDQPSTNPGENLSINRWKVSVHQDRGAAGCSRIDIGTIEISGSTLTFYAQGVSYPIWQVALSPDGSANESVGLSNHPTRKIRVKVDAGTSSREVSALSEEAICGVRYIPY